MTPIAILKMRKAGVAVSVSISPVSQSQSGAGPSNAFSAEVVSVTGGTASSFTWSFPTTNGMGSWSVASGQGTASAVAEISGLSSGDLASADFRCAVVVNGTTYNVTAPLDYSMF